MSAEDYSKNLFTGEGAEAYQAMYTAIHECANDCQMSLYQYMEDTPRTTFCVEVVDKLTQLGYKIIRL